MSKIKFRPLRWLALFGGASIATLAAAPAWSHGVLPGNAGHGLLNPGCFRGNSATSAAAWNLCTGGDITALQRSFVVPFQTQNSANLTFRARVRGNGVTATTCRGVVTNLNDSGLVTSPVSIVSTGFTLIEMGTLFVPVSSTAQLSCDVAQANTPNVFTGGAVLSTAG
jgi:hypothetical protein